jgi:hypothetical protein
VLFLAPDRVTIPLDAAVWRAPLGECDTSEHATGKTGAGKTELAALMQQHFGPGMDRLHLPGSWSSTGNALEKMAFLAKDALFVVDDFIPSGSAADVARMHREADRFLRSQGNGSGRDRMRADTSLRLATPPRGLTLSTGEDIPRGQSLQARMFVIEMEPTDLNFAALTAAQKSAADGVYAAAMAGYLRWLAKDYGERRARMKADLVKLRDEATQDSQHRRTPEIVANLMLGMKTFLDFALESGAILPQEAASLTERAWKALRETAKRQDQHQQASDPVNRFLTLLASAIAAGQAHVATPDGEKPGDSEESWGWRSKTIGAGANIRYEWEPQGARVGWLADADTLYLEPAVSYSAAQKIGQLNGESLSIAPRTLHKRMRERGLLVSVDEKHETTTIRRKLEGHQQNVLHILAQTLYPQNETDKTDIGEESAPEPAETPAPMSVPDVGLSPDSAEPTSQPTSTNTHESSDSGANVGNVGLRKEYKSSSFR